MDKKEKHLALHWDLLNLMRFSRAQFSSLSISTALLNFMPSAHLLVMSPDHLLLPPLTKHFFLTPQIEEEILAQSCQFPACLTWYPTDQERGLLYSKKSDLKWLPALASPSVFRDSYRRALIHQLLNRWKFILTKFRFLTLLLSRPTRLTSNVIVHRNLLFPHLLFIQYIL